MNKDGKLSGRYDIEITGSDENDVIPYSIVAIPEKAKRPTVSIHGVEKDADEFVKLDDTAKKAIADQGGKKGLLVATTEKVRDAAISEGSEVPESIRYATNNGRSVLVTAKYPGKKLDDSTGMELKSLLKTRGYEEIVEESLTISIPKGTKATNALVRKVKAALKEIEFDCEVKRSYKTKSGIETYQKVEEFIDTAGKDVELLDILRPLRADMSPILEVKVSTKQALAQR